MRRNLTPILRRSSLPILVAAAALSAAADDRGWTSLTGEKELGRWREPTGAWFVAGDARPDAADPNRLAGAPGRGVIINGPGKTRNLTSREDYGDVEAHVEFLIPRGSNSGVKLQGLYEIQISDSASARRLTGSECGGVYPRAELLPRYHHIDDGHAPLVNAARPAGEWQTLEILFKAPKFDTAGKKTANARFVKVILNGKVVQQDVELKAPTGHAWRLPEVPRGPFFLQADHGPVAFRNIRIRRLD